MLKFLPLLTLLLLGGPAALAADPAAGKAAYATCVACHGDQGQGNRALNAPRLNHLRPVYISAQLHKFRNGIRGGETDTAAARSMAPMAAMLADDAAIDNVAAYIASLDSAAPEQSVAGDAAMGGDYYNQFCGACHGADGGGNPSLNSPRLAGTDDWYLEAQLLAFRNGQRGALAEDTTGRQMRAMAVVLPDEQAVRDVVAYLQSLGKQD